MGGDVGRTERQWQANLRLIEDLCLSLERLGGRNIAASRIGEYKRAFHRLGQDNAIPVEHLPNLLASMKDFHELRRIVAAVEALDSSVEWATQIRNISPGIAFPAQPDSRPDGRDTQFECFVAAVMVLGGAKVRFAEPDLLVGFQGQSLAVAAKRPRSETRTEANVRKGIKQVKRSKLPGLVAVDFSTVRHHGEYFQAEGLQDAVLSVRATADEAVAAVASEVGSLALESGVLGVIGHVMLPVVDLSLPSQLSLATSLRWTFGRFQRDANESNPWLDAFEDVCRRGLSRPLPGDEFFASGLG